MKTFINDERAVSPILGFMLVAAIVISMLTYVQVYSVPVWNTEIEFEHMDAVYEDMMEMASDIEDVAVSGVPKSSDIQLGVEYPSRAILRNPSPGMVGTLSVEPDQTIAINYTKSGVPCNKTYSSCSIRYTAFGTAMHPTVVYKHGIVIRDYGEYGNSTTCEQTLLSGDNINLVIIIVITNGSYSSSSMETGSLPIYYDNSGSETVSGNITQVNITMTTNYTSIWRNLLADVNTSNTTACISDNKIYINSSATRYIVFPNNQTSTGALYAGFITFSTELPPGVVLIIPTVTTQDATGVGNNNATLNMTYDFKDYDSGEVRFAYKESDSAWVSYTAWVSKNESGYYFEPISGLSPGTTYYFKAQLKYDSTVIEGTEKNFTTEEGLAGDLEVDTSGAGFNPTGKQLKNITLKNNGTNDITIEYIRVSWTLDNDETIKAIFTSGNIWTGNATSGKLLDVDDVTLSPGGIETVDFKFDSNMDLGQVITIDFLLNDSTIKSITYP